MKKTLQLIVFALFSLASSITSKAQIIPNGDFEEWINHGPYEDLVNWKTYSVGTYQAFGVVQVTKTTDAVSGNYALRMQTGYNNDPINPHLFSAYVTSPEVADTIPGGFSISFRPEKLMGYFKYEPFGDTCMVWVYLTKFNPQTLIRENVGFGMFMSGAQQSSYIAFQAPIEYFSNEVPDSARIIIHQTIGNLNQNTVLYLDALTFDGITGLNDEITKADSWTVYPNPVSGKAIVNATSEFVLGKIEVVNLIGKTVLFHQVTSHTNSVEIDLINQPEGMYIIKITDHAGKVSQSKILKIG